MGMRRHLEAVVARRRDDCADLVLGELRVQSALGDRQHAAGRGDLDQIGAVLVTLPHRLHRLGRAVDHAFDGTRVGSPEVIRPAVGGVCVATRGRDRLACGKDAWTGNLAGVDRVAQRDAGAERVAEVTHRGEARLQGPLRIHRAVERDVRAILPEAVDLAAARILAGQVDVHVHEARHQGRAAQVDHGVALACPAVTRLDGQDAPGLDHDRPLGEGAVRDTIDQATRMNQGGGGRQSCRQGPCGQQQDRADHLIATSSTSNTSVAPPGITPPAPRAP